MSTGIDYVRVIFVSADVESLIEEPARLPSWVTAVTKEITEQKPVLAVLHLQGLKTNSRGQETLKTLTKELDNQPGIEQFAYSREFHDLENLGLCSFYYFNRQSEPALFDFQRGQFSPIDGHRSEDVVKSNHVQCARISQGDTKSDQPAAYMLTKWRLFGKPFSFVNLALTAEASPLDGVRNYPTETVLKRRRELETVMEAVQKVSQDDAVLFSGNFQCQLEKEKLLKDYLHHNTAASHEDEDGRGMLSKVEGIDIGGKKLYSITESCFDFLDLHEWVFSTCNGRLIRKYDTEMSDKLKETLFEPSIYFAPNGPYGFDDDTNGDYFLRTAAPAWNERVLCNKCIWEMMHKDSFTSSSVYYGLVGAKDNIGHSKMLAFRQADSDDVDELLLNRGLDEDVTSL